MLINNKIQRGTMTNTVFEYKWIEWQGLAQIIFPASFAGQGVLNKDSTAWLDGTTQSWSQQSTKLIAKSICQQCDQIIE
jgi:hypothetical protein